MSDAINSGQPVRADIIEALRAAAARGESMGDVAKALGRTRNSVVGLAYREGIKFQSRGYTPKPPGARVPRPSPEELEAARAAEGLRPRVVRRYKQTFVERELRVPRAASGAGAGGPVESKGVHLGDLGVSDCRWPLWGDGKPTFWYCGNDAGQEVYCEGHRRLAYQPPRGKG